MYGLKVINSDGGFQIDSTYMNFSVIQAGSATPANIASYMNTESGLSSIEEFQFFLCARITLTDPTNISPQVFISPPANGAVYAFAGAKDTTGDGLFNEVWVLANDTDQFDYIIYSVPGQLTESSENYGMRVYNSADELVYDSGIYPMVVKDLYTPSGYGYNTTPPSNTYITTANSSAYFLVSPLCRGLQIENPNYTVRYFSYYTVGIMRDITNDIYLSVGKYAYRTSIGGSGTLIWTTVPPTVVQTQYLGI